MHEKRLLEKLYGSNYFFRVSGWMKVGFLCETNQTLSWCMLLLCCTQRTVADMVMKSCLNHIPHKGAFTNYVYKIWLFFDHLPPSVYIFYGIKVYKKSIFLTTYPPPLVNVVCERPLGLNHIYYAMPRTYPLPNCLENWKFLGRNLRNAGCLPHFFKNHSG